MPSETQHPHRRQKGPPADKRDALDEQGVAKKADQGQKHWDKLGLREHKPWEEVLPLWQQLQWYKYTGAQKGGAVFAHWPDSDQWGTDVWTANVPSTIKELAMRQGLMPQLPPGTTAAPGTTGLPTTLATSTGPGALDHSTAALLMTLGNGGVPTSHEQGRQESPAKDADRADEGLESEAQSGFPRFLCKIREAAEEYVQHEVQQCDVAVERWRSECTRTQRQLNASETARHAMDQKFKRQLQTALLEQEERLLQQQADLLRVDRERIKELETELASSAHDRANGDSQHTETHQTWFMNRAVFPGSSGGS
ncbi:hypothetical protein WJX73_007547 [Symbiochloris irregularis]|uniref:Uncharacterized protein n=1 Tax=Symbiochloris irregularis TaxID=706552 RepID=A0AAW1NXZ3_9CHLO